MIGISGNYYYGRNVELHVSFNVTTRSIKKMMLNEIHNSILSEFIKEGIIDSNIWDHDHLSCLYMIPCHIDDLDNVLEYWMDNIHVKLLENIFEHERMYDFVNELFNNNENYPLFPLYMISKYGERYDY